MEFGRHLARLHDLDLARAVGGPALDLACGTRFQTIPLAELGLVVTDVGRVPGMLDRGRCKAGALPIRWLHADCRCPTWTSGSAW